MVWRGGALLVAVLASAAAAPAVLASAAAAPAAPAAETAPTPAQTVVQTQATPPPDLQALEQKMEQLQVNSERFSLVIDLGNTSLFGKSGPSFPLFGGASGELSISPQEASFTTGFLGITAPERLIGGTLYTRQPDIAREDGGRPWVSSEHQKLPRAIGVDPLDVGGANGTGGAFTGLVELVSSGQSFLEVGPTIVEGQPVTEFTASIEAAKLPSGRSAEIAKKLEKLGKTQVEVALFIAPDGLPVRTSLAITADPRTFNTSLAIASGPRTFGTGLAIVSGPQTFDTTFDILAINFPVSVQAPSASETISKAQLRKLQRQHTKGIIRLFSHSRKHSRRTRPPRH